MVPGVPGLTLKCEGAKNVCGIVQVSEDSTSLSEGTGFGKRRQRIPSSPGFPKAPASTPRLPRSMGGGGQAPRVRFFSPSRKTLGS